MAIISKVEAVGLWSHWQSTFEFSPGLTVITGPNDSGKSSLIRIIRWVFLGEPQGDAFLFKIKDEETGEVLKETNEGKAIITLDNGVVITKIRRGKKTIYKHSSFKEPFETATVPKEVKDALGIKYYSFGDFEAALNFAFQLEAPFLISEADSAGAKVLGQLAGTEAVDLAIGKVRKDTYQARESKLQAKKDIEKCNAKLLEYENLDQLKEQLELCEDLIESIDHAADRADRLQDLNSRLDRTSYKLDQLNEELDRLAVIPDLEEDLKDVEAVNKRYELLLELYSKLDKSQTNIERLNAELKLYEDVPEASKIIGNIEVIHSRTELLTDLSTEYDETIRKIQEADRILEKTKRLGEAAEILGEVENNKNRLNRLNELWTAYVNNDSLLEDLEIELLRLSTVENADQILKDLTEKQDRLKKLSDLKETFGDTDANLFAINSRLDRFKGLEEAQDLVNRLSNDWRKLMDLRALKTRYRLTAKDVEDTTAYLKEAKEIVTDWEEELNKAWEEAGGICPFCEQPVKDIKNHKHQ